MAVEAFASAVNSSHLQEKEFTGAIDRVHALGLSNGLGSDMLRFKDGLQPKSYNQVLYGLVGKTKGKMSRGMATKLAELAIHEAVFHFCPECKGAKEMIVGPLRITCRSCEGSGVRRHTDASRAVFLGVTIPVYQKLWEAHLYRVAMILDNYYRAAIVSAQIRMR